MAGQPIDTVSPLYHGESVATIAGFPTIYHYHPPASGEFSKPKPLIVCVPGALHLARIFYGGHNGHHPEDFLAHWLGEHGFGVLSVSYPLETESLIMPLTAAHFRIQDWGRQAAKTAKRVIEEHALSCKSVVLISWSMGGRMVVQFNIAAKELGLHVQQYISFAATPGISDIRSTATQVVCSPTGYFRLPPHVPQFYTQLDAMEAMNGGRPIIPRDVYNCEYLGGTPINLIGIRLKYDGDGAFVQDELTHEEDSRVFDVPNLPLISAIYPSSILDAGHSLTDSATWGFLLTYKLESDFGKEKLRNLHLPSEWRQFQDLVHSAPRRLIVPADGNHFFFVGRRGAQETAEKVVQLLDEGSALQLELSTITTRREPSTEKEN